MSTAGVSGLLVITMIALAAPVLAVGVQRARVPDVVIEIVAGIVVGPSAPEEYMRTEVRRATPGPCAEAPARN